jgi:hypothetical protein
MAAKLSRLTHKTTIHLHLVTESLPFAVLAPGGQSRNFWIHPRMYSLFLIDDRLCPNSKIKKCIPDLGKVKSLCSFNWAPRHEGVLGEWMYSSTHSLTSALDGGEWSASRPGRFTPRERAPGTHWIEGWVCSEPFWQRWRREKFPALAGNRKNPDRPARSPAL